MENDIKLISLIIYFFIAIIGGYKMRKVILVLSAIILFSFLYYDIFMFIGFSRFIIFMGIFSFTSILLSRRLDNRFSFLCSFILLLITAYFSALNQYAIAEKAAIWTYIFFNIGLTQAWFSLIFEQKIIAKFFYKVPIIKNLLANKTTHKNSHFLVLILNSLKNIFIIFISEILIKLLTFFIKLIKIIVNFFIKLLSQIINFQPKNIYDVIFNCIKIIFLTVLISTITYTINIARINYLKKQEIIRRQRRWDNTRPIINLVEPALVYRGMKVVIYGRNFGWKNEPEVKLFKNDMGIVPDEITDNKVVFSVPLDWSYGNQTFQIEKIVGWDGKDVKVETDSFSIKVIPVTGGYTKDDEEFFRLLPSLSPETRERNGYD